MKLLLIGPTAVFLELKSCLLPSVTCSHAEAPVIADEMYDAVFDTEFDTRNELPETFVYPASRLIVGSAVKRRLTESIDALRRYVDVPVVGMNLLPTFVSSAVKECSFVDAPSEKKFEELCDALQWRYKKVKDEIGMVTPRVLCMIINEAARTLEEKTASKEDIDLGMKLGTGYPLGPLAWCDKIGVRHVLDVLHALHGSTHDDRYRAAPLLERMRESGETFY